MFSVGNLAAEAYGENHRRRGSGFQSSFFIFTTNKLMNSNFVKEVEYSTIPRGEILAH